MIVCFEGPSAIGKSTLCEILKPHYTCIPEVNVLYKRNYSIDKFWYYNKQIERYKLASANIKPSILDGDIFQPLWYNWTYSAENHLHSLEETLLFYRNAIAEKQIRFPDLYIIFYCDFEKILSRKTNDTSRKRRNFNTHIKLINNQLNYFKALKRATALRVVFIAYNSVDETKIEVQKAIASCSNVNAIDQLQAFNYIEKWLKTHHPLDTSKPYNL